MTPGRYPYITIIFGDLRKYKMSETNFNDLETESVIKWSWMDRLSTSERASELQANTCVDQFNSKHVLTFSFSPYHFVLY